MSKRKRFRYSAGCASESVFIDVFFFVLQDYAIRLAKSKRDRLSSPLVRSVDSVLMTTSSPMFIPQESSKPGGKISLLKMQLDEQR